MTVQPTLAEIAATLEQSPDYRVLRRLVPRTEFTPHGQPEKTAILLDVETTGLDTTKDEIIELGMVKFSYLADGRIGRVIDTLSSFNQPSIAIPAEITALTGITDEMVAGHSLDEDRINAFASEAVVVIAHNAGFDRKFTERYASLFVHKAWACSVSEVEWRSHGFEGSRLSYLLMKAGLFHEAHRAVDDCQALLEILAMALPELNRTVLSVLLERARRKTVRVWAEQSPFELKDELKRRGYRWSDGADGRPRSWYIDVDDGHQAAEIKYLQETIYQRDAGIRTEILTAFDRFSARA
ncbi:3'-5' exonuclease [Bradyrhizobium elkanii]|uniref:3'-5' exonuclease n=1 Tax=Bradyrhizobium elkanii TaxID=29448 RepID=UPI001AE8F8A5|nr:3'-5' exonuclease [Bradyrhizobium elkanii]MBP2427453.1 DNA polymerase-3 subunit epsilon [Bradyrhizobium elkanii]MCP1970656.1 DNA polymerase-3 subunit epsilon [Bradyrhizobium elkanii]MCS4107837.1 DNA polymerase-3 subunit epsilon [Bradyrhizobium elkanii]WLA94840.1 3'-5' exonuclease [Bradyrhizobium elkanii]